MSKSLSEGQEIRTNQLRTLKSVDDMVDTVMNRVGALGEGGNTVGVFTSDNAYQWGEHGLVSKYFPYSESIRVPFMVRWPGKVPGRGLMTVTSATSTSARRCWPPPGWRRR